LYIYPFTVCPFSETLSHDFDPKKCIVGDACPPKKQKINTERKILYLNSIAKSLGITLKTISAHAKKLIKLV
jgi:hypothetical protein